MSRLIRRRRRRMRRKSKTDEHMSFLGCLLGVVLEASWSVWGASWVPRGSSWGRLGFSWGPLGSLLGPSWGHLGAILGPLGAILGHLGVKRQSMRQHVDFPMHESAFRALRSHKNEQTSPWDMLANGGKCWQVLAYAGRSGGMRGAARLRQKL